MQLTTLRYFFQVAPHNNTLRGYGFTRFKDNLAVNLLWQLDFSRKGSKFENIVAAAGSNIHEHYYHSAIIVGDRGILFV